MSGDAERSVVTVGGWGAERGGLDAGGEGGVVTVTSWGGCARCAVARTPPSCARELPAVSARAT